MYDKKRALFLTKLAILIAIEIIIAVTPLGSLPAIGPIVMTLAHIPVIIGAIVLGIKGGLIMGFVYGLLSFIVWTFMPPSPIAFLFTPFYSLGEISGNFFSLVICFVPRILIGLLTYFFIAIIFKNVKSLFFKTFIGATIANFICSVILLTLVYVFFGQEYAMALNAPYEALIGIITTTIVTSGIPESILGGLVAYGVAKVYKGDTNLVD
ncbi:Pantothenate ECF transporter, substrate-specific component [Candidatus Arthromitus sp. SFB-mouse-NL]|uniref:ECF transporter S component n=1 Tax=Candidatus Arthromitus sp. SFB-mouse-NL TaxID=1508644 RepID=UPI00049A5E08|nr:ECF transporter S component [Candidatus Arthromitus sp. SFB-mouse-NL]AID44350.1 Pantothenate ECF transporter, substrate-specific component [Candidatus Arthromitus sp. SFB-mouse-NL]